MNEIITKKASVEDFDDIFKMFLKVKNDLKNKKIAIWDSDEYPNKEIFLNDIKENNALIATYNNEIVGYISFKKYYYDDYFDTEEENLEFIKHFHSENYNFNDFSRLMSDPDYRNVGIGSKLLLKAEEESKDKDIIFLVHEINLSAMKLYLKLGYQNHGLYDFRFGRFFVVTKKQ